MDDLFFVNSNSINADIQYSLSSITPNERDIRKILYYFKI